MLGLPASATDEVIDVAADPSAILMTMAMQTMDNDLLARLMTPTSSPWPIIPYLYDDSLYTIYIYDIILYQYYDHVKSPVRTPIRGHSFDEPTLSVTGVNPRIFGVIASEAKQSL